jgi:uncharacterized protein
MHWNASRLGSRPICSEGVPSEAAGAGWAEDVIVLIHWGEHMASVGYHEPIEELSDETRDMHRAIVSLMEELEAIDWYNQRVSACKDEELKAILMHNRDEEKEHAAMMLEWIRRKDPRFSAELKEYLFTDKPITHIEQNEDAENRE